MVLLAFQVSVNAGGIEQLTPMEATLSKEVVAITPVLSEEFFEETLSLAPPTEEKFALTPMNDDEAFFVRRIAEFWKDGDFALVQSQIQEFFGKYPESPLHDYFLGILGDLYLQDNAFDKALTAYERVYDPEVNEQIILNKLQCYYELSEYDKLSAEGILYLSSTSDEILSRQDEFHFLLGESLFRQALEIDDETLKHKLAAQAKPFYTNLVETPYENLSLFALAEIHSMLGENEKATDYFLSLSERYPDKSEDLLFQAATLQASIDQSRSIELFNKVLGHGGSRSHDASFNLMVLLFQNEDYTQIVGNYDNLASNLTEEALPTYNFILGKSYFSLENYKGSSEPMQKYIEGQTVASNQLKNALLIQMTNASKTADEQLFSTSYSQFENYFPSDPELPKAQFLHAMVYKELGDIGQAFETLSYLKKNNGEFASKENFLFEYSLLAHNSENWDQSYISFKTFMTQFPANFNNDAAEKYFFSSALNLLKSDSSNYSKTEFYSDLQVVLEHENIFTEQERREYALLAAKIAYEIDELNETNYYLGHYLDKANPENTDHESLAEAYYLAALTSEKMTNDPQAFCFYLENAQELNPSRYQTPGIHLQLYNAYISLSGLVDTDTETPSFSSDQKDQFVEQAAQHLYSASLEEEHTLRPENSLWLANHYYSKASQHPNPEDLTEFRTRAIQLYTDALTFGNIDQLILIDEQNLSHEGEVLKFSKLLSHQDEHSKQLTLLQELLQQQSENTEFNWKYNKQALFELANCYTSIGESGKALETYTFLSNSFPNTTSTLENIAAYHSSKLRYNLLDGRLKTENNEIVHSILNNFKELQIRKNVESEPIHLEAALDYATIRSEITDQSMFEERYLFFLGRMKEDYTNHDDAMTQLYLSSVSESDVTQKVYDNYMKFIEAEMNRTVAKQMKKKKQMDDMKKYNALAFAMLQEIQNDSDMPRELQARVTKSINEINSHKKSK